MAASSRGGGGADGASILGTASTILQQETDLILSRLHSVAVNSVCPIRLLNSRALAPTKLEVQGFVLGCWALGLPLSRHPRHILDR